RLHGRLHRLPAVVSHQGRLPAVGSEPAHRHPAGVPVPGTATPVTLAGTRIGCQPLTGSLSLPSTGGVMSSTRATSGHVDSAARWSPQQPASARPSNTTTPPT